MVFLVACNYRSIATFATYNAIASSDAVGALPSTYTRLLFLFPACEDAKNFNMADAPICSVTATVLRLWKLS